MCYLLLIYSIVPPRTLSTASLYTHCGYAVGYGVYMYTRLIVVSYENMKKMLIPLGVGMVMGSILLLPVIVSASATITAATINGGAPTRTQVAPGGNILVSITALLTDRTKWKGTNWGIANDGTTSICANNKNAKEGTRDSSDGAYTETFTIKAPAQPGLYNMNFLIDEANNCGQAAGALYSVSQVVQVGTNTSPPVIDPHDDILVLSAVPIVVDYESPTVTDDIDQNISATCVPTTGSTFPLGETIITCTAQDNSGNQAIQTTFKVTVVPPPGTPFVMASQQDESYFCSPDWRDCFTGGAAQTIIPLGLGSTFGIGTLKSVTIAKDENSPFVSNPWIIEIACYTDAIYSTICTDWVMPTLANANQTHLLHETTASSIDNKYWVADFTDTARNSNYDGTPLVQFNPNYYYRLIINDNGWEIAAYGSQSLAQPYWVVTGATL